jgi:coiled-coil domain-containing protein 151
VVKAMSMSTNKNPGTSDDPALKQMRVLENRLDKLMIKFNEAQSMKKTYEVILRKFKDEKRENTRQLDVIEKSLKGKGKDLQDVI